MAEVGPPVPPCIAHRAQQGPQYALRRKRCHLSVSVPVKLSSLVMPYRAQVVRVTFAREVVDERDARSTLTMLAQLAWERERNYVPVVPQLPDPVGK